MNKTRWCPYLKPEELLACRKESCVECKHNKEPEPIYISEDTLKKEME